MLPDRDLPPTPVPVELTAAQRKRANLFRWYSPKARRIVEAESYLEYRHLLWREIDPHVVALCERPGPRIDTYVQGTYLRYTFDAWLRLRNGTETFVEVTPAAKLTPEGVPERWPLVRTWCQSKAIRCDWVTDKHLAANKQLLDNWEFLLPYVAFVLRGPDRGIGQSILSVFGRHSELTLSSIAGFLIHHDAERVVAEAIALLYRGELIADLTRAPVRRDLVLRRPPSTEGMSA